MSGYGKYAATYVRMGWPVFPLPDAAKFPPPNGRTGRNGRNATLEEVEAEALTNPDGNVAVRVTGGMIGIDVDAYDGKPGAETLAALVSELGPLPPTVLTSSRNDGVSGIRFFRVPEGVEFITKLPGIEIVQTHHRYALVWPSTHDKTGDRYMWLDSETREVVAVIPHRDNVPELPSAWLDRLTAGGESNVSKAAVEKTELDRSLAAWCGKGEPCSHMRSVINDFRRHVSDGEARHDSALQAQLAIVRYGEAGHRGGRTALAELKTLFFDSIGGDRDVSKEWRDGIVGAGQTVMSELTPDGFRGCDEDLPDEAPIDVEPDEDDGEPVEGDDPEDDEDQNLTRGRDGRRRLNVRNRKTAGDLLRSMIGTDELSGLFHRDGELVYCPRIGERGYIPSADGEDDGPAQVRIMLPLNLKTKIEIVMSPGAGRRRTVSTTDEDGEPVEVQRTSWEPKMLPLEVASHVHDAARTKDDVPNLRTLDGVTHTPIMRPDGSIITEPGYDTATRLLYLPTGGLIVPDLPSPITRADIGSAVGFLSAIVGEFPFVDEYHRANWFGALFTPFMRAMLPPPYPAFVIDAPSPGSGKSYLASILRVIHGGVIRTGWPNDDAEFGKSVLSILIGTTAPVVTFDNVRGKIRSSKFEGLLTSTTFSDRLLGQSREASSPNDRLWTITANNAEIGGDLARRCYWITIDPKMPRPHERTGFSLDLRTWPKDNRGEIIRAILTIIRGWVLAGKPSADQKRSDDYAVWDAAIEGLLNWAGFSGQFGFRDVQKVESDDDREWGDFVEAVYRTFGSEPFRVRDITGRLKDTAGDGDDSPFTVEDAGLQAAVTDKIDPGCLPGELADKWSKTGLGSPAGFTKSLGRWIKNRAGRYVGELAFQHVKADAKRGDTYRVDRFA